MFKERSKKFRILFYHIYKLANNKKSFQIGIFVVILQKEFCLYGYPSHLKQNICKFKNTFYIVSKLSTVDDANVKDTEKYTFFSKLMGIND